MVNADYLDFDEDDMCFEDEENCEKTSCRGCEIDCDYDDGGPSITGITSFVVTATLVLAAVAALATAIVFLYDLATGKTRKSKA